MPPRRPIRDRLSARLSQRGTCLLWTGAVSTSGYGVIGTGIGNSTGYAHRVAYELAHGEIPDGYQIDHLCHERLCCNPAHLEAVTQAENLRRQAESKWGGRTHCVQGHPLSKWWRIMPSGRGWCARCGMARRARKKALLTGSRDHVEESRRE